MKFSARLGPSVERCHQYFRLDREGGRLFLRERPQSAFANKAIYCRHLNNLGRPLGSVNVEGYIKVGLDGSQYLAHKIIWLMIHGEWVLYPDHEIDHINRVRSDNRPCNLRKVSKSQNQRNASLRVNNTSGVNGVNWVTSKKRWIARIWDGPHHKYLGCFKDLSDAQAARVAAEKRLGFMPAVLPGDA